MLRSLRIFCDLIETQSFTDTARRQFLTQSAVSQHIKALETRFGHRLVERGRRRIRLTLAGSQVYDAGREILKRYAALEQALKSRPTEVAGPLRVGSIYTFGLYELPRHTTRFIKRYPKTNLLLTYLKEHEVYDALLADRIEIGIVDYPKPHPQLAITPLKKERVVLIVPPGHAWCRRKQVRLPELHGQPFIVPQAESPVEEIFRRTAVRVKVIHAFDNIEVTKRAVEAGLGLALVPLTTVAAEVRDGRLHSLDLTEGPWERPIGLLTRKQAELSLPAQKFMEMLLAAQEGRAA